jgi:hypothetical protein
MRSFLFLSFSPPFLPLASILLLLLFLHISPEPLTFFRIRSLLLAICLTRTCTKAVILSFLLALDFATATAQYIGSNFSIIPFVAAERFRWEERVGDKLLLDEAGVRYAFGTLTRLSFIPHERLYGELELRYITGKVPYDGARRDERGTYVPFTTTTAYSGIEANLVFGSTFRRVARFHVTPVAGVGLEYWVRDLDYEGPYGYSEKYTVPLLDGGLRLAYVFGTGVQLFSSFLIAYPLSISESFKLSLEGQQPTDVVLHPGQNPQFRASAGLELYRVFCSFAYESWKLDKSDISHGYYQPDSRREKYGVKLGYTLGF